MRLPLFLRVLLRQIPIAPEDLQDLPNDTSEGRDSSAPVGFRTEENASPKDKRDDPMNSKADFINPPSPANDISDTVGQCTMMTLIVLPLLMQLWRRLRRRL
jgi:hypothetical protein